ncbi:MAG: hypothetical protein KAT40_02495, partial [Bacteroidales bacterium]|nr:hypothetical protein [Bacteroidales bacterium]
MINPNEHPLFQERDLEGLFRKTWEIYKKHFGWLFLYSFLGILVLQSFLLTSRLREFITFDYLTNPEKITEQMGSLFMLIVVFFIGYSILYLFLHYYILYQEWKTENNHFILIKESMKKFALPYLGTMFLAFMILMAGMMLGVMLFVIGMFAAIIYLATVFTPTSALLIIEEVNPLEAITGSFKLVHKDLWKTLGYIVVFYILYFVIGIILSSITMAPFAGNFFEFLNPETSTEMANA